LNSEDFPLQGASGLWAGKRGGLFMFTDPSDGWQVYGLKITRMTNFMNTMEFQATNLPAGRQVNITIAI
jgi:hypothetical protein